MLGLRIGHINIEPQLNSSEKQPSCAHCRSSESANSRSTSDDCPRTLGVEIDDRQTVELHKQQTQQAAAMEDDPPVATIPEPQPAAIKFMGRKSRRRSSISKLFQGDFLGLSKNVTVLKTMMKNGDRELLFSDILLKVNKRGKMQVRTFLLTDTALYNVDLETNKVNRRIPITSLGALSLSTLEDNFIILHVPSEYDYVLVSARKTELVTLLLQCFEKLTNGSRLPITFNDRLEYRSDSETLREITFSRAIGMFCSLVSLCSIHVGIPFTNPMQGGVDTHISNVRSKGPLMRRETVLRVSGK